MNEQNLIEASQRVVHAYRTSGFQDNELSDAVHDLQKAIQKDERQARTITLYRDDSTTQVVYENVKHFFWTAGNTVLTIAVITDEATGAHKYIHWPRERFCWFKDSGQ